MQHTPHRAMEITARLMVMGKVALLDDRENDGVVPMAASPRLGKRTTCLSL